MISKYPKEKRLLTSVSQLCLFYGSDSHSETRLLYTNWTMQSSLFLILSQNLTCLSSQLAFYVNLHRAVIGPSATLTGRWRPDIDLRRMLTGLCFQYLHVVRCLDFHGCLRLYIRNSKWFQYTRRRVQILFLVIFFYVFHTTEHCFLCLSCKQFLGCIEFSVIIKKKTLKYLNIWMYKRLQCYLFWMSYIYHALQNTTILVFNMLTLRPHFFGIVLQRIRKQCYFCGILLTIQYH